MSKSRLDIRRAMTEHGISYAMLSERTGIDKGNISKLFTGNPTLSKIEAVADAIGIDIRELFYPTTEDDSNVATQTAEEIQETHTTPSRVGMIICPQCHCGFEITGIVTPSTNNVQP